MALAVSIHITKHAHERLKQRLGLGKSARMRHVSRVLLLGKRYKMKRGRIKNYCDKLRQNHSDARGFANPYFYGRFVYIFFHTTLVTVFPIPHDMENHVESLN